MLKPNWYPNDRQLRQFAAVCIPGFAFVGGVLYWVWAASPRTAFAVGGVGAALGLVGLAAPSAVRWLYLLLMAVTLPIGLVVSAVLLRVIFYLILTPLGLVFRLVGRDPLLLKRPQVSTYWLEHEQRQDPLSYYRQA